MDSERGVVMEYVLEVLRLRNQILQEFVETTEKYLDTDAQDKSEKKQDCSKTQVNKGGVSNNALMGEKLLELYRYRQEMLPKIHQIFLLSRELVSKSFRLHAKNDHKLLQKIFHDMNLSIIKIFEQEEKILALSEHLQKDEDLINAINS